MKFHHFKIDNWKEFEHKFLKLNKLRFCGDGAFSFVYHRSHRARHVYKICDEFHHKDIDGYMVYLKHVVIKNQNNPHVPKVYGVNTYEYIDEDGHLKYRAIIKMEKLQNYHEVDKVTCADILIKQYGIVHGSEGYDYDDYDDYDDAWIGNMDYSIMRGGMYGGLKNIRAPKLVKIMLSITTQKRKYSKLDVDIHNGNIMWRKTGRTFELVITDPLS